MGNPLKKTMVFLGLAEEEFDDQNDTETSRVSAKPAPAATTPAPQAAEPATSAPRAARAQVTPLRRVTPTRQTTSSTLNEILTVHPTKYSDAAVIAENFRDGIPVVINLSQMGEGDAKRLIDFASGLSMGLHGRIERVTSKVFLLSPEHIALSGDEREAAESSEDASIFVGTHSD